MLALVPLSAFGPLSWVLRRRRAQVGAAPAVETPELNDDPLDDVAGAGTEAAPDRFGRYRLIERIGEGGMAEVYTALDDGAPRDVLVIKRLRQELCANPVAVEHFLEEGEIVRGLRHPNIVTVRDCGAVDGRHYIAGEYVSGRDAGRLTRRMVQLRQRPLSPTAILHLAHEVLCGLEYAHHRVDKQGRPLDLVHRDITPENVMLTTTGEVKLLDFGIARADGSGAGAEADGVKGNVDFMSPEQARGQSVDRRSDLFSLGLVIYFCAARAPLYRGKSIYDRLLAAARGPGVDEQAFVGALPSPLPEILLRALAIDPKRRFQTAAEMRGALAGHAEGGALELGQTVTRVFGDELADERARIDEARGPRSRSWFGLHGRSASRPG